MKFTNLNQLCDVVRETSFALHCYHKNGHVEKIYENGLAHRLRKQGLEVKQQHPLKVLDEDGTLLGEFFADLFVENQLVVELKAVRAVAVEKFEDALLVPYSRIFSRVPNRARSSDCHPSDS